MSNFGRLDGLWRVRDLCRRVRRAPLSVVLLMACASASVWNPPPLFPTNSDSTRVGSVDVMLADRREVHLAAAYLARDSLFGVVSVDAQTVRVAYSRDSIVAFKGPRDREAHRASPAIRVLAVTMAILSIALLVASVKAISQAG